MMTELKIENKEIKEWLLTRQDFYYYCGNGLYMFANFSQIPLDEIKGAEKCKDTDLPLRSDSFKYLSLDKEYMATYSMPKFHLKIAKSQLDDITYDLIIHCAHLRVGDGYEQVFRGYIQNLDDLKNVFRLLGVEERWIS